MTWIHPFDGAFMLFRTSFLVLSAQVRKPGLRDATGYVQDTQLVWREAWTGQLRPCLPNVLWLWIDFIVCGGKGSEYRLNPGITVGWPCGQWHSSLTRYDLGLSEKPRQTSQRITLDNMAKTLWKGQKEMLSYIHKAHDTCVWLQIERQLSRAGHLCDLVVCVLNILYLKRFVCSNMFLETLINVPRIIYGEFFPHIIRLDAKHSFMPCSRPLKNFFSCPLCFHCFQVPGWNLQVVRWGWCGRCQAPVLHALGIRFPMKTGSFFVLPQPF